MENLRSRRRDSYEEMEAQNRASAAESVGLSPDVDDETLRLALSKEAYDEQERQNRESAMEDED